jgi:TonB-dependent Receptor Plug Domain
MTSRIRLLTLLTLGLCAAPGVTMAADTWAGRTLSSVLNELRAAGLPLLYSSQMVNDDLIITTDPGAILQLQRLRLALDDLGLALQELDAGQGYAIVRSDHPPRTVPPAVAPSDPSTGVLEEVSVYASRYKLMRDNTGTSSTNVPHASLEKTAGIEQDVLRSVQYLPGTSGNSLSTLTHVRGGYEDENLVRFDGVELYKPVHLKSFQGLFGLLDPDWVQSLNFYSGAYPVQFGNHNAAVIDIEPRVTRHNEYAIGGSLLYSRVVGLGSYDAAAGHWLVGYRRSNVSAVLHQTEINIGDPEFDDLVLRNSYAFDSGELRMGTLILNDDLQLQTDRRDQQSSAHDHDIYLWLGWQQDWSEALHYNVQLSHSQLSTQRTATLLRDNISDGTLLDRREAQLYTLDNQLSWQLSDQMQWLWGLRINHSKASYRYASDANYFAPLATTFSKPANQQYQFSNQYQDPDYASWLSLTRQQGAWRAELGLRYDVFPYLQHGSQLSPRLNVQYTLSPAISMHLSAGRYTQAQALHMLDSSVAAPALHAPERMQQYILGWTQTLSPALQLRVEAYHKYGSRLAPHSENLLSFITLTSELEIDRTLVSPTRSRAQGIEVSLTAPAQQALGWWLNYSWSRVQDQLNGDYVRRVWDQPHAVTAGVNWTGRRWLLSGSTSWHGGWAYTPVTVSADGTTATVGTRNAQRFKAFASVELRAQYTLPVRSADLQLFIELRNALARNNQCCRDVEVFTTSGSPVISIENNSALHLIPIAGFNLKF